MRRGDERAARISVMLATRSALAFLPGRHRLQAPCCALSSLEDPRGHALGKVLRQPPLHLPDDARRRREDFLLDRLRILAAAAARGQALKVAPLDVAQPIERLAGPS